MTDTPDELAAVEALLAERDAIHGWLSRLGTAAPHAPDAVRDRVRRDYQVRMDGLTERLREHADAVAEKLRADRAEHDELRARAAGAQEALAEAELRHSVGEYSDEKFADERTRHSSDLETYELALTAAAERIASLDELHRLVGSPPAAVSGEAVLRPPPVPEFEQAELPEGLPEAAAGSDDEEFDIIVDDLAPDNDDDLLAIFDDVDILPSSAGSTPDFAPLSFRPSGGHPPEPARPATPPHRPVTPPLGMPSESPPRFVRTGETAAVPPHEEPAQADPFFDQEIVAAGPTSDSSASIVGRTVRCGECGAMNRPLEWYCEKCGAELTAL
ncbi:MAG: hypothetical protein V4503_03560 [Gemmatimonadota bacterium]